MQVQKSLLLADDNVVSVKTNLKQLEECACEVSGIRVLEESKQFRL